MNNTTKKKGILKKLIIFAAVAFGVVKLNEFGKSGFIDYGDTCSETSFGDTYYESTDYGDIYYGDDIHDNEIYAGNYLDEEIYFEDNYYEDIYCSDIYEDGSGSGNINELVGTWSNEKSKVVIYDNGYAEVTSGYQSAACGWTASETVITFVPNDHFQYQTVSYYYEVAGDVLYITLDNETEALYKS
ncbi:MAG: hypothetical protein ACOX71_08245 [Lachnospiraceae bacterium]|jgi:hypothetical protein